MVGGALGSMVAPGIGTALGSKLGSMAGNLFEMEGEISHEELEFEMARRVVRIGATAANRAARLAPTAPPARVARRAVVQAARIHAPAALRPLPRGGVYPRFRVRRPVAGYGVTSARSPYRRTTGRGVPAARRPSGRTTAAAYRRAPGRPRGAVRPAYGRLRSGFAPAGSQAVTTGVSYRPGRGGTSTGYRPSGDWGGYYPGDPDATWSDGAPATGGSWTGAPATGGSWTDGSAALSGRWVRRGDRIIVIGA
jgi:hypothetical protein